MSFDFRSQLHRGVVIPAHPLALDAQRRLDERRQRALTRYYLAAGAGGVAVGVHTTQFAIREAGLFETVLTLAAEVAATPSSQEVPAAPRRDPATMRRSHLVLIGGICGATKQAVAEAETLRRLGYHAGLLGLGALRDASEDELIAHCRAVAGVTPVVGFYLHAAAGGRLLPYSFWRRFAEIENVVAIKIAAFNRYQTLDVVRAVIDAGRADIALYTGNDDNIVADLITSFWGRRIVGGLLGHWAVWTRRAVEHLDRCQREPASADLLRLNAEVTDCNAAFFDAANGFRGCIAGLHEVLRRQGLLEGLWCLDPAETLSPGQREEIERVYRAYPHLNDDDFIASHRDEWLRG